MPIWLFSVDSFRQKQVKITCLKAVSSSSYNLFPFAAFSACVELHPFVDVSPSSGLFSSSFHSLHYKILIFLIRKVPEDPWDNS